MEKYAQGAVSNHGSFLMDIKTELNKDAERSSLPYGGFDSIIGYVRQCAGSNELMRFYQSRPWKRLRREVLEADRYECQPCKACGLYTRADHVHHVKHVKEHPELAVSKMYMDSTRTPQRNLVSVCARCHESVYHPDRRRTEKRDAIVDERWD